MIKIERVQLQLQIMRAVLSLVRVRVKVWVTQTRTLTKEYLQVGARQYFHAYKKMEHKA